MASTPGDPRVLLGLVSELYAAASNPAGWPSFLSALGRAVAGPTVVLVHHDLRSRRDNLDALVGLDAADVQRYTEHYAAVNPWIEIDQHRMQAGVVVSGEQILPLPRLRRTEFYSDFLRPHLVHMMGGAIITDPATSSTNITIHRPEHAGPFDQLAIDLLSALIPHLRRAIEVHHHLTSVERRAATFSAVVDELSIGVVVMNAACRVDVANRAARAVLDARDGLRLANGQLFASRDSDTSELHRLVASAVRTSRGLATGAGGWMALRRPSMRRPISLLVVPVNVGAAGEHASACAAVFITDPERADASAAQVLARAYGLTPAESRLAGLLLEGCTPADAAERLTVSMNTARTHLKGLFSKVGVRRQSQLVNVLLRGAPPVHRRF